MPAKQRRARCALCQPAAFPCFYGYVICFVCGLAQMQAFAGTSTFFAFSVPNMLEDPLLPGMTSGSLGGMYAVGGVIGAVISPLLGQALDRWGARVCLPVGFVGLA